MHLTLIIPELLWPEPADQATLDQLACPALEKLLGHAQFRHGPRQALETCLAERLGTGRADAATGRATPHTGSLAAARLHGEAGHDLAPDQGHWLCADPIHLQFHHERVILGDASLLDLADGEIQALVASLNQEFPDLGRFHAPHPQRWYLEAAPGLALPDLPPPSAATGRQLGALLPEDPALSRLMNELQMLLHTHPINRTRESLGKPIVNGLWLWGGAPIAATGQIPDAVWGDVVLARGLARQAGLPTADQPAGYADWRAQTGASQAPLVVLDALLPPSLIEDGDTWRQHLQALERDWFAPLAAALGKDLDRLSLVSPTAFGTLEWQAGRLPWWKFWQKPASLQGLTERLARAAG